MRRHTTSRGTLALAALAVAWALVLSGCARVPVSVPPATPPEVATATPPASGEPASLDSLELGLETIAKGLDSPLLVTHAGDGSGRLFVVEQGGTVRVVRGSSVSAKPFLDVRELVSTGGERGLLGMAFSPDYAASGRVFINYTDRSGDTVIARYDARDPGSDTPAFGPPRVLLRIEQPYSNHNGGCIVFAEDGRLWVGMGDGGSGGDPQGNGQNPRSLLGKMLALDVDAERPEPEIVMSGLRNPWRFSFDRETGDVWIGDVGQNAWEEIDLLRRGEAEGANLGWNLWEGTHPYPADEKPARDGLTFPVTEYPRDIGRSVTGGYVYRGSSYPVLEGVYLYADFEAGWIAGLRVDQDSTEAPPRVAEQRILIEGMGGPSSFGEDEGGEVYVCDYARGTIHRVTANAR